MIVRNYFVLGLEPGSVGLAPFLREVPKTTAVATTAMKSLLAGPPPIEGESAGPSTAIPEGVRLLGLAIAAEHAGLLGGYLTAANLVGGGLRIELRLPVT